MGSYSRFDTKGGFISVVKKVNSVSDETVRKISFFKFEKSTC
jgi:hypothetical protein